MSILLSFCCSPLYLLSPPTHLRQASPKLRTCTCTVPYLTSSLFIFEARFIPCMSVREHRDRFGESVRPVVDYLSTRQGQVVEIRRYVTTCPAPPPPSAMQRGPPLHSSSKTQAVGACIRAPRSTTSRREPTLFGERRSIQDIHPAHDLTGHSRYPAYPLAPMTEYDHTHGNIGHLVRFAVI